MRRHTELGPRPEPRGPGTPTCRSWRCFRCTPATVAAVSSTERPNTTLERLDIPRACLPAGHGPRSQRLRLGAAAAESASPPGAGPGAMPRAQSPAAARRGESSAERLPYSARERDFWRGLGRTRVTRSSPCPAGWKGATSKSPRPELAPASPPGTGFEGLSPFLSSAVLCGGSVGRQDSSFPA